MKKKLLLSQLNKDSMEPRQTSQLMGGNYCAFEEENQAANDAQGKCSCWCDRCDYYDTSWGISAMAQFDKYL